MRSILTFLLFLVLAGPALAVDGVLEINQACAVNTGCFPGDTPGFPVTISGFPPESSYRLTSSLQVPGTNTDGLFLFGPHITIDFNGFSLSNLTVVAGTGNAVTATGTGPFPPTARPSPPSRMASSAIGGAVASISARKRGFESRT